MFWRTDYLKDAKEIDQAKLRGVVEHRCEPFTKTFTADQRDWLWADDSYLLLTDKRAKKFLRDYHKSLGMRTYRAEVYDCDDFVLTCLAELHTAAAHRLFPRPPAIGQLDFFPKNRRAIDQSRHAMVWMAFQDAAGGVGVWLYEPQTGHLSAPEQMIKETVLVYGRLQRRRQAKTESRFRGGSEARASAAGDRQTSRCGQQAARCARPQTRRSHEQVFLRFRRARRYHDDRPDDGRRLLRFR